MWAVLDLDNETVLGVIPPDKTEQEAIELAGVYSLIKMTLENSPAYSQGKYIDGKFYPPKGNE